MNEDKLIELKIWWMRSKTILNCIRDVPELAEIASHKTFCAKASKEMCRGSSGIFKVTFIYFE